MLDSQRPLFLARRGSLLLAACLLLLASAAAWAGIAEVRKQVEASMLVTGMVYIAPDGSVQKLELDKAESLPPGVLSLLEQAESNWRFEPHVVDGVATLARARMSVRVVAKQLEGGDYALQLRSAYFGRDAWTADEVRQKDGAATTLRRISLKPPSYPQGALMAGAKGTVYLVVKIGPDGRVQDALVEQVNLQVLAREQVMDGLRDMFGKSALRASKQWAFAVPTEGKMAAQPYWLVRVPVDFAIHGDKQPTYGEWSIYVPGPKQKAPWVSDSDGDADAMVAGGVYPMGQGVRLLTPLQSG